ncbi:MAG TPA: hypothetical protein VNQ32_15105 [Steroidobacteraceae bacterium]|nr:hypothetical protein [Steroidobacteraceae bacterium]
MTVVVLSGAAAVLLALAALIFIGIRSRNMHYWLPSYLRHRPAPQGALSPGTTVYVAVADHFEPFGGKAEPARAAARVERWCREYPLIAARHADSTGRHPQHTHFYPIEEYDAAVLDQLAELTRRGFGDVDVHYHHDGDTADKLAAALLGFVDVLHHRHGLLLRPTGPDGRIPYCFVHGNWALDNSRPDGRWCGVDNELKVLVDTGCVADFTLPSAPSDTQTRTINSIYFARGRDGCRKSHDTGRQLVTGDWARPEELLIVQGPLGLNWRSRKLGVVPRIENAEISADARPTPERVSLWSRLAPRIPGAGQHVFIKLHTHGAEDPTMDSLLGGDLDLMWTELERQYRDAPGVTLRYVTAWEMYGIIKGLAHGEAIR